MCGVFFVYMFLLLKNHHDVYFSSYYCHYVFLLVLFTVSQFPTVVAFLFFSQPPPQMIPILLLLTLQHVQCVDRIIEERLNRLAFGSCNKVHSNVSDEIWKSIETFEPEMFAYVIVFFSLENQDESPQRIDETDGQGMLCTQNQARKRN